MLEVSPGLELEEDWALGLQLLAPLLEGPLFRFQTLLGGPDITFEETQSFLLGVVFDLTTIFLFSQ